MMGRSITLGYFTELPGTPTNSAAATQVPHNTIRAGTAIPLRLIGLPSMTDTSHPPRDGHAEGGLFSSRIGVGTASTSLYPQGLAKQILKPDLHAEVDALCPEVGLVQLEGRSSRADQHALTQRRRNLGRV